MKSLRQSTIDQLAINSTQKRKKPQSQSRHQTVKRGFKSRAKSLIQLNVWYLKKIYLTKTIQHDSCACTKTELDMAFIAPTMATMQGIQWNDYHPIASNNSHHAPIEFLIPPHTEFYTDLSQAYLYIKFRILQQTGEDLDTDAKVFPINNFFHSLFSGIDLYISNK